MKSNKTDWPLMPGNNRKIRLTYATRPKEHEMEALRETLRRLCGAGELTIEERADPSLISGYVLQVGDKIYDNSTKTAFRRFEDHLRHEKMEGDVISLLKSKVQEFSPSLSVEEGGSVLRVADNIVAVDGISHAVYGEIVLFDTGVKGMVQSIDEEKTLCILLGDDTGIGEGARVVRTGKRAGIPVGTAVLGRVLDPLGAPIDGKGDIAADSYYMIEREAPGVIQRRQVNVPLHTGILAIDSMFPIGRGQRELIIGDRQTGKTSIAVDTILSQRDKGVICVYVAIGQKASTIARVVSTLKKFGADEYSVVVAATASDYAPLQYIAPYSGTAVAEYFMDQGKDVLIVYDDLSKHAVAYRSLSLLLERSPGREAYPGDVFYLHSRLLERSSRLDEVHGGGSLTALPIIETQAGDVSAYIPTNVISITDGQIFLESDLFFAGQRPAVNVGLSVSRVGGAAQTKAMKKAAGTLRIDLAQYKEMEAFSQFSSELDEDSRMRLHYGKGLMELLKQPLYHPRPEEKQVVTLCVAMSKKLLDLKISELREFVDSFYSWLEGTHGGILDEIRNEHTLSDEHIKELLLAVDEYKKVSGYAQH